MRFLVFPYLLITLLVSGGPLLDGHILGAVALLIGSTLGFAAGGGMRGSFYLGNRRSGVVVGILLLLGGVGLAYYSEISLSIFGLGANADVWPLVGFVVAFLAARPEDAGAVVERSEPENRKFVRWMEAINTLGDIMDKRGLTVFPESELPLPKTEMKNAIQWAWLSTDNPSAREALEVGYSHLSHFRPEITEPVDLDLSLSPDLPSEELVSRFLDRKGDLNLWEPVSSEARQLSNEFNEFKRARGSLP